LLSGGDVKTKGDELVKQGKIWVAVVGLGFGAEFVPMDKLRGMILRLVT
jgi:hypothetical protein